MMDLTARDGAPLPGALEAACIGTPLIVSSWPILQDFLKLGAEHVSNSAEGIQEGVLQARRERLALREGILEVRG